MRQRNDSDNLFLIVKREIKNFLKQGQKTLILPVILFLIFANPAMAASQKNAAAERDFLINAREKVGDFARDFANEAQIIAGDAAQWSSRAFSFMGEKASNGLGAMGDMAGDFASFVKSGTKSVKNGLFFAARETGDVVLGAVDWARGAAISAGISAADFGSDFVDSAAGLARGVKKLAVRLVSSVIPTSISVIPAPSSVIPAIRQPAEGIHPPNNFAKHLPNFSQTSSDAFSAIFSVLNSSGHTAGKIPPAVVKNIFGLGRAMADAYSAVSRGIAAVGNNLAKTPDILMSGGASGAHGIAVAGDYAAKSFIDLAGMMSDSLNATGRGAEVASNFAVDNFVGLTGAMSDSLNATGRVMVWGGENFTNLPKAVLLFTENFGRRLGNSSKMLAAGAVRIGEKAGVVPQTIYDGGKKILVFAAAEFGRAGASFEAISLKARPSLVSDFELAKKNSSVIPASLSVIPAIRQPAEGIRSLYDSILSSLKQKSSAVLPFIKGEAEGIWSSVKSFGQDTALSLKEIFVDAPQTIVKDTGEGILSWRKSLKNFAESAKLALQGRKVAVEKGIPSTSSGNIPRAERSGVEGQQLGRPTTIVPQPTPIRAATPPPTTDRPSSPFEKGGLPVPRSFWSSKSEVGSFSEVGRGVLGSTTIDGNLIVNGNTTLKSKEVKVAGPLFLENNFTIASVFSIDATTGNVVSAGDITASGKLSGKDLIAKGKIDFSGATIDFSGAKVTGLTTSGGTIVNNYSTYVSGPSSGGGGGIGGQFNNLSIAQDATISGALTVVSGAAFNSTVAIGDGAADTLTINASTVSIPNGITFANGAVTFGGSSATTTFGGNLAVNGAGTSTFAYGATMATTGGALGVGTSSPVAKLGVAGNAYISGNTTIGNSTTFFVDATNNRVGVSTSSPLAKLHIAGTADTRQLMVQANSTQNANIFEYQNAAGSAPLVWISPAGNIGTSGTLAVAGTLNASSTFAVAGAVTSSNLYPWLNNNYDIGAWGFAWRNIYVSSSVNVGAGAASSTLSSSGNLTLTGDILPAVVNSGNIGSLSLGFKNIFASSSVNVSFGAASTTLSSGNIMLSGNLLPSQNNNSDLGAYGTAFRDIYASGTLRIGATSILNAGELYFSASGTVQSAATSTFISNHSEDSRTSSTVFVFNAANAKTNAKLLSIQENGNDQAFFDAAGGLYAASSTIVGGLTVDDVGRFRGQLVLGDGGDDIAIDSNDWDISSAGVTSNLSITTSTLDGVVIGGTTASTGKFTAVTSTVGFFGSGAATTGTLTVAGSSAWLTVGNGSASTTIGGYSATATTTNPYGIVLATTGGNVGIGTSTPASKLHVVQGTGIYIITAENSSNSSASFLLKNASSGGKAIELYNAGANSNVGVGNFGIYNVTDDRSLLQLFGATGNVQVTRDAVFQWGSDAQYIYSAAPADTGISRGAAGKVYIGNGNAGSFVGSLIASRVGAGTTAPSSTLEAMGTSTRPSIALGTGSVTSTFYADTTSTFPYGLTFASSGGNVGIGTASPSAKLDVNGSLTVAGVGTFNGQLVLGDGGDDIAIDSNDWDISSAGVTSNLSITTSTLDGVVIGGTTASTGKFNAVTSTVGFFGSGAATTGTLTVAGSSAWLTVGNGSASTTIGGYSATATTTNPYGIVLATTGGNVGIGTASPSAKLDVNGSLTVAGVGTFNGQLVLGDNGDDIAIDSNDWDISSAGVTSNLSITTSTLDGVVIGGTTASTGKFTAVTSTVGFFGSGAATTGTLTVAGSSAWLTVGNGSASTTIGSYSQTSTSTFPFGVILGNQSGAGTGLNIMSNGNVGIGTANPGGIFEVGSTGDINVVKLTGNVWMKEYSVNGIAYFDARDGTSNAIDLQFRTQTSAGGLTSNMYLSNSGNVGIGTTAPGAKLEVVGGASSTNLSAWDNLYIGRTVTSTLTTGNRGSATSTFYSDLSIVNRDVVIGGAANSGWLWTGDGTATTSIRGGTAGSTTSTFEGDVSIANLFLGSMEFDVDAGLVSAIDLPVSASASAGTKEGYSFLVDGIPVMSVVGESNGSGEARNGFVGIGTQYPSHLLTMASTSPTLAIGTGSATSTLTQNTLSINTATGYNLGRFYVDSSGNVTASGTIQSVGFSTSTLDGVAIGQSTASTGKFNAVTSTVGFFGSGAATTGTLTVAGSSAWLTVGNGSASTTIGGYSATATTTNPYGIVLASSGGNVGIGTASPSAKLDVNGSLTVAGLGTFNGQLVLGDNGDDIAIDSNDWDISSAGVTSNLSITTSTLDNITLGVTTPARVSSTLLSVMNTLYIGGANTSTLTTGNRGSATSSFYSDLSIVNRDVVIGGASGSGWLWAGDGTATTSIRGGTAGSTTSTFEGDVSIANLYVGSSEFVADAGIVGAFSIPVSASVTTGTEEGYTFAVDNLDVARIVGTADALGSVWDLRLELTDNKGTATTTLSAFSTSSFAQGLQATRLNITSTSATSTFANGIQLNGGCVLVGGACLGGSGANTALSNLASVAINTSLLSDTANTDDLGSYTFPWKDIYASGTLKIGASGAQTATSTFTGGAIVAALGGNFGVGSSTPKFKFSVNGTVGISGLTDSSNGYPMCWNPDTGEVSQTTVGCSYVPPSSIQYKKDVETLTVGLDVVNQLRPVSFTYISNNEENVGLIAEEVEKIDPRLIIYKSDGSIQTVKYLNLTAYLAKAIQELSAKFDAMSSSTLSVSESGADIAASDEYFDFAAKALINAKSVASVSGSWSLSEEGEFVGKSVKAKVVSLSELIVAGEKETDASGAVLDPAVGNSFIPNGETAKVVYNNRVKKNSQVFITFRDNTGGPWWISNQGDGFFEVSVSASMGYNIRFSYWVVSVLGGTDFSSPLNQGGGEVGDSLPPEITAVAAVNITDSGATINWSTSEDSDSVVTFATSTGVNLPSCNQGGSAQQGDGGCISANLLSSAESSLSSSHSLNLTGLQPQATYYYIVKSTDAAGNIATSQEYSFVTVSSPSSPLVTEGGSAQQGDGGSNVSSSSTLPAVIPVSSETSSSTASSTPMGT